MSSNNNIVASFFLGIFSLVTVLLSLAMVGAYLAPIITPEQLWWLPILGLGMPILIVLNIVAALLWAYRWSYMALVPIIALAIGYSHIGNYFSFSATKEYPYSGKKSFRVASYNVMGFRNEEQFPETTIKGYKGITIDSVASFAKLNDVDIL